MASLSKEQIIKISVALIVLVVVCVFIAYETFVGINYGKGLFKSAACYHSPVNLTDNPFDVEITRVSFDNNGDIIRGYIFKPNTGKKTDPVLIYAHGYNGTAHRNKNAAITIARTGVIVVTFDFRYGATLSTSDARTWKMSIDTEMSDLNVVIDAVKDLDYINKDEIFIGGLSLGGLVCGLVAPTRDDIRAMCLCYPAFDEADYIRSKFKTEDDIPNLYFESMLVGKDYLLSLHRIDPYELIAPYKRDVLIIHGTKDDDVPYESSVRAVGIYKHAKLITIEGAGHGFGGDDLIKAHSEICSFINNIVGDNIVLAS